MIKKIFIFFIFNISLLAHDEFTLEIIDNKNNTITIIGDEEHKQGLAGALIKVESLISGEILFKDRLPKESKITIDIPKEEMAHHAVKLLLDRIHNGHNSAARIELPCKLLVRESCSISPH